MSPAAAAIAHAERIEEASVLPQPCSIHDDRLRELETEQASQRAQFAAGADMFAAIQDSIKALSEGVRDSMNRVEDSVQEVSRDVKTLGSKVGEVQVKQAVHEEQLRVAADDRQELKAAAQKRKEFWRGLAFKVALPVVTLTLAAVASTHGKGLIAAILKAIAGG